MKKNLTNEAKGKSAFPSIDEFKVEYFWNLKDKLITSSFLIAAPEFDGEPFPPSFDTCERFTKWVEYFSSMNEKNNLRNKYESHRITFTNKGAELLKEIDIKDKVSFHKLAEYCVFMYDIHSSPENHLADSVFRTWMDILGILLIEKSYELLGFWTMKIDEKRRNIKSAGRMTIKRQENLEKVRPIFEKWGKSVKGITLAMSETGITTDKTIKGYFKTLEEEKTQ